MLNTEDCVQMLESMHQDSYPGDFDEALEQFLGRIKPNPDWEQLVEELGTLLNILKNAPSLYKGFVEEVLDEYIEIETDVSIRF